ncbi:MAG TPA: acyl carrier protein [Anaerolineaceae bacterium]
MHPEIIPTISKFIVSTILEQPSRNLKPGEPLITSGLIDSMSLVDLALFVEDTFGVHLDDTELTSDTFDTLEQLAEIIAKRQQ